MEVREPSARYLGVKLQTEVGELPRDWSCSPLGAVADILTGFPFSSAGYSEAGVRLLRGSNVKRDQIEWREDLTMYWPDVTADIRKYVLKAGDVVIAMDGSLVGRSFGALSEHDVPALLLQRVARVRSSEVEVGYLKHWICSERFTAHCDAVKTTTAIPHISPGDIRSFLVAVPPTVPEQQVIGQSLSDTAALIDSLEQLLTKKRQIKQGAMQELLTGKRRLPGFSSADPASGSQFPKAWAKVAIGDIAEVKTGPFGSALHERDYVQAGTPIITVEHLGERGIEGEGAPQVGDKDVARLQAYKLAEGDIVFSRVGSIDRNARVSASEEGWLFSGRLLRLRSKTCDVDSQFLSYLFHGEPFRRQVERVAVGQTMASLNTKLLSSLEVVMPALDEQRAIAGALFAMDSELESIESRLTKARALKQAMAQALLTGRIRLVEGAAA